MGLDQSRAGIYRASQHGVRCSARRAQRHLDARPWRLTTRDMPVPTCATCHMSGLEGQAMTHDTSERLSWYLFAEISQKRPAYVQAQNNMKEI
mgnify:CR=1 FL=1